jgi:hypothetical protein
VLLALALAVVHVNAWAAGPYLGIVSPAAALATAALASVALAALAWHARQQALFVVGVGGALVAPFVTGSATGRPLALAGYGWVVLAAGIAALPTAPELLHRWRLAARMLGVGGTVYTVVLVAEQISGSAAGGADAGLLASWSRSLSAVFALACAAVPLLLALRRPRAARAPLGAVALGYCAAAAGALLALDANVVAGDLRPAALALAGTLATHAALRFVSQGATTATAARVRLAGTLLRVTTATAAVALPLAFLAAALLALRTPIGTTGAVIAATWAALAALAARTTLGRPAALPTTDGSTWAVTAASAQLASAHGRRRGRRERPRGRARPARARRRPRRPARRPLRRRPCSCSAPSGARSCSSPPPPSGCAAAVWAGVLLTDRPEYAYTPFVTAESLGAGAVVAAWYAIARRVWATVRPCSRAATGGWRFAAATSVASPLGRQEFAAAVSPDVSTFLLIGYFAVAGIGAIALGRARAVPAARQVGLALALYAALKAFLQASGLDAVGLRVGSYLLVGGFLLAVGYWYRAAGARAEATEPAGPPTPSPNTPPPAVPPTPSPDAA